MSPAPPTDPRRYYTETLPEQFNRALEIQEALGEEGRSVLEEMRAVNASIRVDVRGEGGGSFFLNIENGRMGAGEVPAQPPFLTLIQDSAAFERLAAEAGDSAMAVLGGLSGLAGEMKLTRARIENLSAVKGLMRFEVTGDHGFSLLTHFGTEPVPDEPNAKISVDGAAYKGALGKHTFVVGRAVAVVDI